MEVKILGSVSPYCKDDKNCPGYLVYLDKIKILLDCGNGISRFLDMSCDLENMIIVISHLHRDHYGDLLSLAYATCVYHNLGILKNKVKVYLPNSPIVDYMYLSCIEKNQYMEFFTYDKDDILDFKEASISFSLNPHDVVSHSIKIDDGDRILVYSGDTGFEDNSLEKLAKSSNLLICEATFLRGQKKGTDYHLCAFEAAMIADRANVDRLMLTHFWPEIDKQEYVDEAKEIFTNVSYAQEGKILKLTI